MTPTPADPFGDPNRPAAQLALRRGRLDAAEELAVASVRRCGSGVSAPGRAVAGILLATIQVQAGEPQGLRLAHDAITATDGLSSVRTRRRLEPLAVALESRPGGDAQELARMAWAVAA